MNKLIRLTLLFLSSVLIFIFIISCQQRGQNERTTIGVILPLTGEIGVYGQSSKNGIEIAMQEDSIFIKDNNIHIIFDDEKGSPIQAVNGINKLISINKCSIVIGGISSSCALAMAPVAEKEHVVLMCPFASSPLITNAGDYIFRIMPSDAFQASLLPGWLQELNYKKVAIIYTKNDWAKSLVEAFKTKFSNEGGVIVFEDAIDQGEKNFKSVLSKVINIRKNCDALFLPTYPEEGAALLKQLKEYNINLPVFGGDTWANNLLISLGGTSVENVRFLAPMQYEGLEFQSFEKKYHIKFGTEPDLPASAGYDAMKLILKCLKDLKASNQNITGDNLKALLYKIQNFKGATGITTFDSNGDVISKEFSRRTIIDGNIVTTDK